MEANMQMILTQRMLNLRLQPLLKNCTIEAEVLREASLLHHPGISSLPEEKLAQFQDIIYAMNHIYNSATVTKWENIKEKNDIDDISEIMKTSGRTEELKYYWLEWRNMTGKKLRTLFQQYVRLMNDTAIVNGLCDAGELWTSDYETEDLMQLVGSHWGEVRPLYQELHAYVRGRLLKAYGEHAMESSPNSPIPAHLTGNLWAQNWINLYNITEPFMQNKSKLQVKWKGISLDSFKSMAEGYFVSLGFPVLPESFWSNSVLTKGNTSMYCEPSAWDMYDGKDFRLKMCCNTTVRDFIDLHHQLTHIHYFREYKDLPVPFRQGPNPAFHESMAGAVQLSVMSPPYLAKKGLLAATLNQSTELNYLLELALDKVAFLPFSYIVDLWRFKVFTGEVQPQEYNSLWWQLSLQYQGIAPPTRRSEDDFDPGCKYHIATNKPYVQNFLSTIMQFQFFEALCRRTNCISPSTPLHMCELSSNRNAGNLMRSVMKLGASKHWRVALKEMTGGRRISSKPLLDFFKPLYNWLRVENAKEGYVVGWGDSDMV